MGSPLPGSRFAVSDSASRSFVPSAVTTHHITAMGASFYWLRLSFRVRSASAPADHYADGAFHGVTSRPPRDISSKQRVVSSLPGLVTFTSTAFRTLSTSFATSDLADLFHSAATSRVSLQGFLPFIQLAVARRAGFALSSVHSCVPEDSCPSPPVRSSAALRALLRMKIRVATAR